MKYAVVIGGAVALMQVATLAVGAQAQQASAELRDPSGNVVGSATMSESGGGVQINVQVRSLPPGQHGIHVHAVGQCDPPDFMSAGGHFNPTSRQHGLRNPQGPHAGDLPNLTIAANGSGSLQAIGAQLSLGAGANSLFDSDGSALVIHADVDDEVTDPTGNSGGRIACGVVARGGGTAGGAPGTLPATGVVDPTAGLAVTFLVGSTLLGSGVLIRRRRRA